MLPALQKHFQKKLENQPTKVDRKIELAVTLLDEESTPKYYIFPKNRETLLQALLTLQSAMTSKKLNIEPEIKALTEALEPVKKQASSQHFLRTELAKIIQQLSLILAEDTTLPTNIKGDLEQNKSLLMTVAADSFIPSPQYIKVFGALFDSKELIKKASRPEEGKCPPAPVSTQTEETTENSLEAIRIMAHRLISHVAKLDLTQQTDQILAFSMNLISYIQEESPSIQTFKMSISNMEGQLEMLQRGEIASQGSQKAISKLTMNH